MRQKPTSLMGHLDEIEELTRNRGADILISNLR